MTKMRVKEKVIRESIKRIEKRLKKINSILDADPLAEIIDGRKEASELITKYKGNYASRTFSKLFDALAKKEKEQFELHKYQTKNYSKLLTEKSGLSFELGDLNNELYLVEGKYVKQGDMSPCQRDI